MDYINRKKEQASLIITSSFMSGFTMSDIWGKVTDTEWRTEAEKELNKLIDQVYKRGLKDGTRQ